MKLAINSVLELMRLDTTEKPKVNALVRNRPTGSAEHQRRVGPWFKHVIPCTKGLHLVQAKTEPEENPSGERPWFYKLYLIEISQLISPYST